MGLLPTLLAAGCITFLIVADAPRAPFSWATVSAVAAELRVSGVAVIVALSIALAVSLQPLQFRLVQLLEGYWPTWLPLHFSRAGIAVQGWRRQRLIRRISVSPPGDGDAARTAAAERSQAAEAKVRERFPDADRLLPTALGNALRSAEDRVGQRYRVESVVVWPRLFHVLPREVQESVDDEVNQLDLSARLCVTWMLAGAIGTGVLLRDLPALHANPWWVLPVIAVWVLAQLSYSAAIESAIAHGVDLEVAVDLHRWRVIDAMRLPAPARLSEERRQFIQLVRLFTTQGRSSQELVYRSDAIGGSGSQ